MSDDRTNSNTASNHSITPELSCGTKARVTFSGSCLKQDKATYNHGAIANRYIVYEISQNYNISSYPTLENCLFGDIDHHKYSRYGTGLARKVEFSFGSNGLGRSCLIFGGIFGSC